MRTKAAAITRVGLVEGLELGRSRVEFGCEGGGDRPRRLVEGLEPDQLA